MQGLDRMTTERDKMLAGALYNASDPDLIGSRRRARGLLRAYNASRDEEHDERRRILHALFATLGEGVLIEPPFFCDYGGNITLGDRVYFNYNCVILDPALVTIGSDVLSGRACRSTRPPIRSTPTSGEAAWRPPDRS